MALITISLFGLLHLIIFFIYSEKKNNFINPLTYIFGISFLTSYFLPAIYLFKFDINYNISFGLIINYLLLFTEFFIYFLTLSYIKVPDYEIFRSSTNRKNLIFYLLFYFFLIVILFYTGNIILDQFQSNLTPREYYSLTRQSSQSLFILSFSILIFFIISLIYLKSPIYKFLIFCFLFFGSFFLGTKSSLVSLIMVYLFSFTFQSKLRINLKKISIITLFIFVAISLSPFLQKQIINLSKYSDYIFNAEFLINNSTKHSYGKFFIEDNFYSRIPRKLFEYKPFFFGSQELSYIVNPSQTISMEGSPSLGKGKIYYEFGLFSFLVIILITFFKAYCLKYFSKIISKNYNAPNFILFLYFAGISIIQVPPAWVLPEVFIIAYLIHLTNKFSLRSKY